MSVIESIINGLINGFMIWVVIILLLVVWVLFGSFVRIAILIVMAYYFVKNTCRLFGILGSLGRKILVMSIVLFIACCSQDITKGPLWFLAATQTSKKQTITHHHHCLPHHPY